MNSISINQNSLILADVLNNVFDGPRRIHFVNDGAPYIRLGDLEAEEVFCDPCQAISPLDLEPHFYLRPGDVLLSKTGDEPRAVAVPDEVSGSLIAPDIYCLRIREELISPIWLSYYLNTSHGQRLLTERSSGMTVQRLRMAELRSLPVVIPPQSLLEELVSLELQARQHTKAAGEIWKATLQGIYVEINDRSQLEGDVTSMSPDSLLSKQEVQEVFRPLHEVAKLAISSRKLLKPDQIVHYVQVSDIDPQSFQFRRLRSSIARDLPSRIRLPLQANQVLILASGSNLGTTTHPVAIVDSKLKGGFASNAFLALEFQETPLYYGMALKHPLVLAQIKCLAIGTVVSTLRKKDIVNLRIPILNSIWREDFNNRAQLAWERRALALRLRRQAMEKAETFLQQSIT